MHLTQSKHFVSVIKFVISMILYLPRANLYIPPPAMIAMASNLENVRTFCTVVATLTLQALMKAINTKIDEKNEREKNID